MKLVELKEVLETLGLQPKNYPHGSNLCTKLRGRPNSSQSSALLVTVPAYLKFHAASKEYENGRLKLSDYLLISDEYYDLIKRPEINRFSHQSDFVSSILPEILCVLLRREIHNLSEYSQSLILLAQTDIVIECNFDVAMGGRVIEKRKRMDVAIMAPTNLEFNGQDMHFAIPAFCAEVKTNIDKNMLSGIESSVETLKRTFPRTRYYAIGEYSDFDISSHNYASTSIDEILVVRHQKRSEVRRLPTLRKPLSPDLLALFLKEVSNHLNLATKPLPALVTRMQRGKLTCL